jgi:hypothetical protein
MGDSDSPADSAGGDPGPRGAGGACTTTESFADHGIEDGGALLRDTYYRLAAEEVPDFAPTPSYFDRIESAFLWAYLAATEERGVPADVAAAVDDARAAIGTEVDVGADLRTEVVPAFYRLVAGYHCAYRD